MRFKKLFFIHVIVIALNFSFLVYAWDEFGNLPQYLERDHFVIYHDNRILANELSWKAEYYYKQILRHLNVENFDPFREKPCPIYLYKNHEQYVENSGAPSWSVGIAKQEPLCFATYERAKNVEHTVFPHELTHLMLFVFFDGQSIPRWLNEGLAEYEEADFGKTEKPFLKRRVKNGYYIKLEDLFSMRSYPVDDEELRLFYAESASVVEFLKDENLGQCFGEFLLEIKKGTDAQTALKEIYQWKFSGGIKELEKKWIESLGIR
ncbi:MAG: hypothetical protein ABH836_08645 [Candidatus Omnitrophota bacterium]